MIRPIIILTTFENRAARAIFQESGGTSVAIDRLNISQRESENDWVTDLQKVISKAVSAKTHRGFEYPQ